MRLSTILACVAPVAAAVSMTLADDAATECYPSDYVLTNFLASGVAINSTSRTIIGLSFSYEDTDTGVAGACVLNATSTNLSPSGAYGNYACDNPLLQFSWGKMYKSESYLLGVAETVCNVTATTSGSFIPNFACTNCANGTGIECTLSSNTSQSVEFSSWDPIID